MIHPHDTSLQLYLDGCLVGSKLLDLKRHLATCGACELRLSELRKVIGVLRSEPDVSLPAGFARQLVQRLADPLHPEGLQVRLGMLVRTGVCCLLLLACCALVVAIDRPLSQVTNDLGGSISLILGSPLETDSVVMAALGFMAILGSFSIASLISHPRATDQDSPGLPTFHPKH